MRESPVSDAVREVWPRSTMSIRATSSDEDVSSVPSESKYRNDKPLDPADDEYARYGPLTG